MLPQQAQALDRSESSDKSGHVTIVIDAHNAGKFRCGFRRLGQVATVSRISCRRFGQ